MFHVHWKSKRLWQVSRRFIYFSSPSFFFFLLLQPPHICFPLISDDAPSFPLSPDSSSIHLQPVMSAFIPQLAHPLIFAFAFGWGWSDALLFQPTWNGDTALLATASPASPRPLASTTAREPARSRSTSSRNPAWCWRQKRRKLWNEPTSKSHTHHQKPLRNSPRSSTWKPAPWSTGSTITGMRSPTSPASEGFVLFALAGCCSASAGCVCFR